MKEDRRDFLRSSAVVGMGAVFLPATDGMAEEEEANVKPQAKKPSGGEPEISAPEDLMREHGVLNRILLIYEEGIRQLRAQEDLPPETFHKPATLVRKVVEDYHEKLEENFIFPAFEKQKKELELVRTLRGQHEAGRILTDIVLRSSIPDEFRKAAAKKEIARACEALIRMYRPHEAREDTVLFPSLFEVIGQSQVKELGEKFEEEHRLVGEDGFRKTVEEVAAIEKMLGIYDLASFTPQ